MRGFTFSLFWLSKFNFFGGVITNDYSYDTAYILVLYTGFILELLVESTTVYIITPCLGFYFTSPGIDDRHQEEEEEEETLFDPKRMGTFLFKLVLSCVLIGRTLYRAVRQCRSGRTG